MHTMFCQDLQFLAANPSIMHTTVRCLDSKQVKFRGADAQVSESGDTVACLALANATGACLGAESY